MSAYTAAYADIRWNDNTRFRTQGQFISDSINSAGWTKVGGEPYIDWSAVTAPGAANTSQGYEIRSSGEGLTVKIEYGSGSVGAYAPALWITTGTGSDGSGNITGVLSARAQVNSACGYSGGSARAGDMFVSGTTKRLSVALTEDTNAPYNHVWVLQKTHDAAFNEDSFGWYSLTTGYNNASILYALGVNNLNGGDNVPSTIILPRSVGDASNIPISPFFVPHPLYGYVAMRDVLVGPYSLIANQSQHTINGRTYVAGYGNSTSSTVFGYTWAFAASILVRYE